MNTSDILQQEKYSSIVTNHYISPSVLFWVINDNFSFDIDQPNSSPDICGVAIGRRGESYNVPSYGKIYDEETNILIYSLKKLVAELVAGRPNAFGLLFSEQAAYKINHSAGELLLNNKSIFLSKRIRSGYESVADSLIMRMNRLIQSTDISQLTEQEYLAVYNKTIKYVAAAAKLYLTLLETLKTGDLVNAIIKDKKPLYDVQGNNFIQNGELLSGVPFDWVQNIKNNIALAAEKSYLPIEPDKEKIKQLSDEITTAFRGS